MMWVSLEERRGAAPRDRSQFPMMEAMTVWNEPKGSMFSYRAIREGGEEKEEEASETHHGPVIGAGSGNSLNGDGDVTVLPSIVSNSNFRSNELGFGSLDSSHGVGSGRESGEVLLGELDELSVVDGSSSGEDHLVGVKVLLSVLEEILLGDGLDVGGGTEDVVTQGLS